MNIIPDCDDCDIIEMIYHRQFRKKDYKALLLHCVEQLGGLVFSPNKTMNIQEIIEQMGLLHTPIKPFGVLLNGKNLSLATEVQVGDSFVIYPEKWEEI